MSHASTKAIAAQIAEAGDVGSGVIVDDAQAAAASPASVSPRSRLALTYFGGISFTVCPRLAIARAQ